MSKIKVLLPDDFAIEETEALSRKGDEMSALAQENYEIAQFQNSLEGRMICFTTQELQDEVYRRYAEPLKVALQELKDTLDRMVVPF